MATPRQGLELRLRKLLSGPGKVAAVKWLTRWTLHRGRRRVCACGVHSETISLMDRSNSVMHLCLETRETFARISAGFMGLWNVAFYFILFFFFQKYSLLQYHKTLHYISFKSAAMPFGHTLSPEKYAFVVEVEVGLMERWWVNQHLKFCKFCAGRIARERIVWPWRKILYLKMHVIKVLQSSSKKEPDDNREQAIITFTWFEPYIPLSMWCLYDGLWCIVRVTFIKFDRSKSHGTVSGTVLLMA